MSKFSGLALAVEKPQRMVILHPVTKQPLRDAEGNEAYLDLFSGDSDVARKHDRTVVKSRLSGGGRKVTAEEVEAATPDRLAALTAGWRLIDLAGQPIDVSFSRDNARELYADPAMTWLRESAIIFTEDRGNFLPASSTTSSPTPNSSTGAAE
ncbi:hypothetical protein [Mesorhizobium sp. KR9-304]|uniref:hypothetical protein n=1 Tax=Mesorhizobium sp. KR9-304 TaxID=3156614 RepID=UPI0032B40F14